MGRIFDEQGKRKLSFPSVPSTPTPVIPQPTAALQRRPAFTSQDPEILKQIAIGLFPGLTESLEEKRRQEQLRDITKLSERMKAGAEVEKAQVTGGLKWLLGIPQFFLQSIGAPLLQSFRTGLGQFGVNVPEKVGPVESLDLQRRKLQEAGAGEILSTLVPSGSSILGTLTARKAVAPKTLIPKPLEVFQATKGVGTDSLINQLVDKYKNVRPAGDKTIAPESPVGITSEGGRYDSGYFQRVIKSIREQRDQGYTKTEVGKQVSTFGRSDLSQLNKEDFNTIWDFLRTQPTQATKGVIPQPPVEIPKPVPAQENMLNRIMNKIAGEEARGRIKRFVPFAKESEQVKTLGEPGKELVTRSRRAMAEQMIAQGEFRKINMATGLEKFTLDEKKSLMYSLEGKAQPINEKVASAVPIYREMFDKWGDRLEIEEKIPDYAPRRFNQFGIQQLLKKGELPTDLNKLVNDLSEKLAMDPLDVRQMLAGGKRKAFFEYERVLDDIPGEYRDFNAIQEYQRQAARRYGIIQEFGKEEQTARSLINKAAEAGTTIAEQEKYRKLAQDYFDRISGKTYSFDEIAGVNRFLRNSMIIGKLNPLTSIANNTQGHINAWLREGIPGLKDVMTRDGGKITKELGLDDLSGMRVGDPVEAGSFANKWMKAIGFTKTEHLNVSRAAAATDGIIGRNWNALKANPQNVAARSQLEKLGMFVEEGKLNEALKVGEIPAEEYAIGIIEGVRQMQFIPMAGERPKFANQPTGRVAWIFHQYLLEQMRLLKDARTHRQIAYLAIIAPLTGIPLGVLRNVITGREQPKNLAEWYKLGYRYGPGTPVELAQPVKNPYFTASYLLGGYKPPLDVLNALVSGKLESRPKNVLEQLFRAAPVPLGSLLAPRIFSTQKEVQQPTQTGGARYGESYGGSYGKRYAQ